MDKYRLVGKIPVLCKNEKEWAKNFELGRDRHVALNNQGDIQVSTVFLGIDHSFGGKGPPLLFETMIFNGHHGGYQTRHSTWEEAEEGHLVACKLAFPESPMDDTRKYLEAVADGPSSNG